MFSDKGNSEYFTKKNQRRGNLANKHKFGKPKRNNFKKDGNSKSSKLINVYEDTKEYFSSIDPSTIKNSELTDIFNLTVHIEDDRETFNTNYVVDDKDTLDMAIEFHDEGLNPLVLSMASDYKPGGGVRSGKTAQEECIFRRTNAFMTHNEEWYPLHENQIIYSPEVVIIKDKNYEMMDKDDHKIISLIAVAAIRQPNLKYGELYHDEDRKLMMDKIESIFKVALKEGHDSLVLGALGCGAFGNPPFEVASIYKTLIKYYGKYFKKIGFAILCVKESDSKNLLAFKNIH